MAKTKAPKTDPAPAPGGDTAAPTAAAVDAPLPPEAAGSEVPRPAPRALNLAVPIAPIDERQYITDHLDIRLNATQQRGLRMLKNGLDRDAAALDKGRRVITGEGDAANSIRWLLEQIAKAPAPGSAA